ncbi:restriction endonuclease [Candidatus Oleimmundimicrobium sp.]|uniref:restriction endonuclease n=1 Tax=Candidatus Oleimmundimicrobium sp. TaxID=3060597 RepID=UPI00272034DB|nr:restriction endonuclease [Candidatus Oleimmundimicrobium sp.]MDO8886188.1 restriction endonuclease [Candidatus Oleimmundimicrobium sp.]
MARKNESILDILVLLPWWVSVALSGISYLVLKYFIPSIEFQQKGSADITYILFKGFAGAAPSLAPIIALVLLIPAPISAINSWRKRKLLDKQESIETVRNLKWREFEELVGEAYRRQGYVVCENSGAGPDGGIDLTLKKSGEVILVQCKQWRNIKVGVNKVRELYGVQISQNANKSILMTSGFFTQEAKNFAANKSIDLVEGSQLLGLIKSVQSQFKATSFTPTSLVTCPKCGSEMILRTAYKGSNIGQKFWGCSKFPNCRAIKPYKD